MRGAHEDVSGDGPSKAVLLEELDVKAEGIMGAGRLPDGRVIPRSEISGPREALEALAEIERVVEQRREQRERVIMGIDFEYCAMRKGQCAKLSYM